LRAIAVNLRRFRKESRVWERKNRRPLGGVGGGAFFWNLSLEAGREGVERAGVLKHELLRLAADVPLDRAPPQAADCLAEEEDGVRFLWLQRFFGFFGGRFRCRLGR
jgi:hypothetical protein